MGTFTNFLSEIGLDDLRQVGGKGANLGHLIEAGFPVPPGFCVLAHAYESFLSDTGLEHHIGEMIEAMDFADLEAVENEAGRMRDLIVSSPVPDPVQREVISAYSGLLADAGENDLVAVRSSVGTKNLASTSFPGQMDTYYNVRGETELVEKVKECWASVFSYPAMVNRHVRGLDFSDVFIAPLVQLMIAADSAGVIFTVNPLNNRSDEMVVNSCFGLGEGVVSGELDCDHFVVDRESLEILDKKIGEKAFKIVLDSKKGRGSRRATLSEEEGGKPSLSPDQVSELVRAARRVEEQYDSPQDIEWAFRGGELFILQSRKITTGVVDVEDKTPGEWVSEFDSTVDPDYPEYTLANISEVMPGVLTPLSITSGMGYLDYGFVKTNEGFGLMRGINPKGEYTFLGVFYGRAHLNLTVLKAITEKLPGATSQEFERLTPDEEDIQRDEKFHPTPGALLTLIGAVFGLLYKVITAPRGARAARKDLDKRIAEFKQYDFEKMPYGEFLEILRESQGDSERVFPLHITASQLAVVYFDSLRKATLRWLDDTEGILASRLVTGLHNLESAMPSAHIWDLSRIVKESGELEDIFRRNEPELILEVLQANGSPRAKEFLTSLDSFLEKFGYRSVFEAEMMLPNWSDDPSYVFAMIRNYLDTDADSSPHKLARRQESDRKKALADTLGRLSGPRRLLLRYLTRQAQKFIGLREYMKAVLITGIAEVKKETNILSRRFTADGFISEPSDIFFLTKDEVEVIMEGRVDEIQVESVVARRRREHERNQTVVLPEYSHGRPRPLSSKELELELEGEFEVLRGLAVSPGKVTGKARVITDPRHNAMIRPGEILVAPVTDAAWTPLFVTAGAIVVDVGGPLSHGSIVAREYGIPGVLSVGLATRLIKTGQVITVDGDHGRVYLHPHENES